MGSVRTIYDDQVTSRRPNHGQPAAQAFSPRTADAAITSPAPVADRVTTRTGPNPAPVARSGGAREGSNSPPVPPPWRRAAAPGTQWTESTPSVSIDLDRLGALE